MLRACQKTRGILPCEVQFARFSSFFFCLLPCTNVCVGEKFKNKIKKKIKKTLQCSSSVLDSLRFAAFCSTAAFLSVTALRALVLRTCLPQCSFIARSGEAGSVAKGISKIASCSPVASPGSCVQGCYTWRSGWEIAHQHKPRVIYQGNGKASGNAGRGSRAIQVTPTPSTHAHTPPEPHIPPVSF